MTKSIESRVYTPPCFAQLSPLRAEADYIGNQLLALHSTDVPWNEIGVLYTARFVGPEIAAALEG